MFQDSSKPTSSAESQDGAKPSGSRGGRDGSESGADHALANPSLRPARGGAESDPRHLWPDFYRLIRECRPDCIVGEQVENAIGHGWLDGVFADLEREGYACGAAVLGAHSTGAPHIRQRLYWVAHTESKGWPGVEPECETGFGERARTGGDGSTLRMGDASGKGLEGRNQRWDGADKCTPWQAGLAIQCRDNKSRRIEPLSFPLAYGIPRGMGQGNSVLASMVRPASRNRIGSLKGYGNAIVPQVAAEFVAAFMESRGIAPQFS